MLVPAVSSVLLVAALAGQPIPAPPSNPALDPAPVAPAPAPGAQNAPMVNEITPELDAAVNKGIVELIGMQNADGSFGQGRFQRNVAVTSLACLALMADGHVPGRGKYAANVSKGLDYVLSCVTDTGLIAGDSANGPMYGHGFATLFLGEAYGMTRGGGETAQADKLHEALVKAVRLIERTQNDEGGWRYNPVPYDADTSVTICQIMALRSARNAGLEVNKVVIDKAVKYVRESQNPDGGFRYMRDSGVSAWPRSAAGVASLYYAGIYNDDATRAGISYLQATFREGNINARTEAHYWYGMYYTAQSMYLAGGDLWATWWPAARHEILARQRASGDWADPGVGNAYGTAMALIVLQMPKRYLPIFQK